MTFVHCHLNSMLLQWIVTSFFLVFVCVCPVSLLLLPSLTSLLLPHFLPPKILLPIILGILKFHRPFFSFLILGNKALSNSGSSSPSNSWTFSYFVHSFIIFLVPFLVFLLVRCGSFRLMLSFSFLPLCTFLCLAFLSRRFYQFYFPDFKKAITYFKVLPKIFNLYSPFYSSDYIYFSFEL